MITIDRNAEYGHNLYAVFLSITKKLFCELEPSIQWGFILIIGEGNGTGTVSIQCKL